MDINAVKAHIAGMRQPMTFLLDPSSNRAEKGSNADELPPG